MTTRTLAYGLSVVTLLVASISIGGTKTTVTGTVRDKSGRPLPHAYVEAIPDQPPSGIGTVQRQSLSGTLGDSGDPWVAVDSLGSFSLGLSPGRYRIRAKDEVDGYPDPSFGLGRDPQNRFPEIVVGAKDIAGVEIVLGAQGAILSGQVRDSRTHSPVVGADIRLQDAGNSDSFVGVFTNRSGRFRYTVPSKPILITATAPGYRKTEFMNGAEQTLAPGESRQIELELEPE